jgi:hypothetical protein
VVSLSNHGSRPPEADSSGMTGNMARIYCEIVILLVERISLLGADPCNYEILRRYAPQNDTRKAGFRMDTN